MLVLYGLYFMRDCSKKKTAPGRPRRCAVAHAFLWERSDNGLEMAQLLDRHGILLTLGFRLNNAAYL